jgi:hypothetical protein
MDKVLMKQSSTHVHICALVAIRNKQKFIQPPNLDWMIQWASTLISILITSSLWLDKKRAISREIMEFKNRRSHSEDMRLIICFRNWIKLISMNPHSVQLKQHKMKSIVIKQKVKLNILNKHKSLNPKL